MVATRDVLFSPRGRRPFRILPAEPVHSASRRVLLAVAVGLVAAGLGDQITHLLAPVDFRAEAKCPKTEMCLSIIDR